jgi:regulatory protein YycI of two-component signal transduction system YycFG
MAKLFDINEVEEEVVLEKASAKSYWNSSLLLLFLFIIIPILLGIVISMEKREEKNKNIESMELAKLVVMDNGHILTQKVKYETSKKIDPDDTSDIFYEVVNGDEKYKEGFLVKFNHRFIQPQQIEGSNYCVIDAGQIQFHIKKEDVKEDLLKR